MRIGLVTLGALIAGATPPAAAGDEFCGSGWFPDQSFRAIDEARGAATADLDASGRPDLMLLNEDGGLQVFLAEGPIGYAPGAVYDLGTNRYELLLGDLDGDGLLDVAATSWQETTLVLRTGTGAGTFSDRIDVELGQSSTTSTLADVDGDGDLDLVGTSQVLDTVHVYLNGGGATFTGPITTTLSRDSGPFGVTLANLAGDSAQDLVVTRFQDGMVEIRAGLGDGTFGPPEVHPVGAKPQRVLARDLSGDGLIDLAVSGSFSDDVTILFNAGGVFAPAATYAVSADPTMIDAADMDGDGDPDLVVIHDGSMPGVALLFNDGAGGFDEGLLLSSPRNNRGLALDDLDGNGTVDLVVANTESGANIDRGTLITRLNRGDGSFPSPLGSFAIPDLGTDFDLAELNGDDALDVVLVTQPGMVRSRFGDGEGGFGEENVVGNHFTGLNSMLATDLDADGDTDLAFIAGRFYIRTNDGNGNFNIGGQSFNNLGLGNQTIRAGDLDGDGDVDLVTRSFSRERLVRLLNNGNAVFSPAFTPLERAPTGIELIDFDGDHDLDIVIGREDSTLQVLENVDGAGAFVARAPIPAPGDPTFLRAGPLNGDGFADLVFAAFNTFQPRILTAFVNDGNGGFVEHSREETGNDPRDLELIDMDGDHDLDIAAAYGGSGQTLNTASFFLNDGSTFIAGPAVEMADGVLGRLEVGDLEGDGDIDAVSMNFGDVYLVARNVCTTFPCPANLSRTDEQVDMRDLVLMLAAWGPCPPGPCAADLTGDGVVDIRDLVLLLGAWGRCA